MVEEQIDEVSFIFEKDEIIKVEEIDKIGFMDCWFKHQVKQENRCTYQLLDEELEKYITMCLIPRAFFAQKTLKVDVEGLKELLDKVHQVELSIDQKGVFARATTRIGVTCSYVYYTTRDNEIIADKYTPAPETKAVSDCFTYV